MYSSNLMLKHLMQSQILLRNVAQAHVDFVRLDDGSFALMELEALKPSRYFRTHPAAADNFADALARWRRGR
jgi:hypothetical protein